MSLGAQHHGPSVAAVSVGQELHGRLHHRYSFRAVALSCAYQNELIFNSGVTYRNRRPSSASPRLHAASCDCRTTTGQRHQRYVAFFRNHRAQRRRHYGARSMFECVDASSVFAVVLHSGTSVISPSSHDIVFIYTFAPRQNGRTAVAQWLTCCATIQKVAGSIPVGVSGIFH